MDDRQDAIRVLIVDDEKSIRDGSERVLSRMGFQVSTASRGEEALEMLGKDPAAIVLLDMKMPGIDGMEVLARIRGMDESILVIVITGFATVETAIEAMKRGAYDFIPKPFEPDQLRIVVSRARERLRLTEEAEKLDRERLRTLADLDTEKTRTRSIIESLPNGVVVTNADGQVVLMNPSFLQLLNLDSNLSSGRQIQDYISEEGLCELILEISRGKHVDYDDIPTYGFSVPDGKYLLARGRPILGDRMECLGAVVNFADITGIKVLDQLKSEFVAKVSHELRSPLSTIHEQLAVVMSDLGGEDSQKGQQLLARAQEKTQGLISLIGDLLDLSRIEAGAMVQEAKPVHLEQLLSGIIDFLGARADAKNQTLTLELPSEPMPEILVDPLTLESIFGNLITNAINYTQQGGDIRVKADLTGINVRVEVADNGFGIETRYLEKIFERFYRVKNENTRTITGTGLGLPIVKGLVDSLGGLINVESEAGRGTTFTVILQANT